MLKHYIVCNTHYYCGIKCNTMYIATYTYYNRFHISCNNASTYIAWREYVDGQLMRFNIGKTSPTGTYYYRLLLSIQVQLLNVHTPYLLSDTYHSFGTLWDTTMEWRELEATHIQRCACPCSVSGTPPLR